MFKIILLLALSASVAHAAEIYTVPADTLVCTTQEAYEEQSALFSAGLSDGVPGCGALIKPVKVVVLEMNILSPSYVRSISPVAKFWVDTTELQR